MPLQFATQDSGNNNHEPTCKYLIEETREGDGIQQRTKIYAENNLDSRGAVNDAGESLGAQLTLGRHGPVEARPSGALEGLDAEPDRLILRVG